MRTFLAVFLALIVVLVPAKAAFSAAVSATPLPNASTISTSGYSVFTTSTVKPVKGIVVSNASSAPLYLAIGASGSEVDQMILPASLSATYYPMTISSSGQRITMKASTGSATPGQVLLNLIYN